MRTAKKIDTGKTVAYIALAGAVGYGIYSWSKVKWPDTDIKNISISVVGLEWPSTDIKNISISVTGLEFPTTDIRNITIEPIGPAFPSTDLRNISISITAPEYPSTDLRNIEISVVPVAPPVTGYTLEVAIEPPGVGLVTVSPSKTAYSSGEKVILTAYPYWGYIFDHWGGWPPYPGVGSTSPTMQITMTADWWVVAVFRKVTEPPLEPPPEPPEPEPEPTVYYCPYCGSPFATEVELSRHMDICPAKPYF